MSTESRLLICHHEGGRTIEDATALFTELEQKRAMSLPLPVFVSDDWDAFASALLEVYGIKETSEYKGIGRKPNPVLVPSPDLKYAQIVKNKANNEVVGLSQRVIYGDPKEVMELLCPMSKGHIHTAYAERINLAFRNHLARFIRKTMNFSKDREIHTYAVDFFQAWYNFVKTHDSLKLEINLDMKEVGFNPNPKKLIFQTPAMVELITDHIWTMKELMTWRSPIL
jgi:IS1 transposase